MKGFTLIELMIVVLIIGIIAAVAYPTYAEYVRRADRTDAQDKLTEVMFEQERYQLRRRAYATNLTLIGYPDAGSVNSNENLYSIAAAQCAGGVSINNCVILTATPRGRLAAANEAPLTLDSRGRKTGPWQK